ncbi:hypothetical protein G6O69_38750 [Pseudenhygromyxa sp. WMMC2535]|uniref:hypothetical protein n=1 Tax=Pseudenhygromyxa sp. WMMC2535 TaxID=2712867 RepID=UPI001595A09A|nr:hypothetical protein [Pseudenhygromyxa sp. WMMC2535]NVB43801.1 hypothetical protein [Pseudenhygromyxa sp. WMMC2535]
MTPRPRLQQPRRGRELAAVRERFERRRISSDRLRQHGRAFAGVESPEPGLGRRVPARDLPSCDPAAVARALEGSELGVDGGARACGERDADRVEVGVVLASLPERVGGLAQGGLAELHLVEQAQPRPALERRGPARRRGRGRAPQIPESLELPAAQRRASDELRVARRPSGVRPQSVGGCTESAGVDEIGSELARVEPEVDERVRVEQQPRGRGIARGRVDAWREACSSAIRRGRSPCGR